MPRAKRQTAAKRRTLTIDEIRWLLDGKFSMNAPQDKETQRQLWNAAREKIMAVWPGILLGCRCYAWWLFESKEPRKCLTAEPLYDYLGVFQNARKYRYGLPTAHDPRGEIQYETEADYLARLELLTPAEQDLPIYDLRENSAFTWAGRDDKAQVQKIMEKLGF